MKRSAAKNIAQDNAEQENITQSNTENATIARGKGKAVSTVYRSHSSFAKLAANLIDLLRFIRHFDTNITEIEGFAFPNNAAKNYVSKVTVEWKHLRFYVNENIYPLKAQIINAVKSTYERQCSIAKKLTLCPNPVKYSVPYSDADLEMLQQLLIQQQQQLVLVQKESAFSLLFEDGAFYYKFSPYPSANRTLTILERKPKTADGPLVLPIKVLTVLDSMLFFVFDAQDYQFELLNWEELLSCLFHIASGVKLALDALHGLGFAHTDVRINNACFHNNQVTLIDFDRATSCTNTVTTSNHFMYNNQGGREMTSVCDLDWKQLGLMILSIITSTTQTQLTIDDVNAQDEDSVVRCLVFDYNWNAAAANHLPKEKDILSVFQRKSTGEDGRQPKREALGEGAPEERS
ncbi:hypothetical protein EMCRGX_G035081 [Ephydatia muelleri]